MECQTEANSEPMATSTTAGQSNDKVQYVYLNDIRYAYHPLLS